MVGVVLDDALVVADGLVVLLQLLRELPEQVVRARLVLLARVVVAEFLEQLHPLVQRVRRLRQLLQRAEVFEQLEVSLRHAELRLDGHLLRRILFLEDEQVAVRALYHVDGLLKLRRRVRLARVGERDGVAEPRLHLVVGGHRLLAGHQREAAAELAAVAEGFHQLHGELLAARRGERHVHAVPLGRRIGGQILHHHKHLVADVEVRDGLVVAAVRELHARRHRELGLVLELLRQHLVGHGDDILAVEVQDGHDVRELLFLLHARVAAGGERPRVARLQHDGGR